MYIHFSDYRKHRYITILITNRLKIKEGFNVLRC